MARAGTKVEFSLINRMFLMIFKVQQNILYQINTPPPNGELKLLVNPYCYGSRMYCLWNWASKTVNSKSHA